MRPCQECPTTKQRLKNVADPSVEEFARRVRLGEDSILEFKHINVKGTRVQAPGRDDVADELAAMANSRGGTLVLGVDDKRRVEGIALDSLDVVERWAREICNDHIKPALDADILKFELPNADGALVPVLRIDVPRSLFVHESPHGYFRRIGSSKRKMPPDVLARAFQDRSQSRVIRFDETPVPRTRRDDLHYALTERFLHSDAVAGVDHSVATDDILRKLRIVDAGDAAMELTLAGVLLCTEKPQRWLPHAYVQAVCYAGERTDTDYQVDARDISGPLDAQVIEALDFVRRNMFVRATKEAARVERPQFSERAVFEALVNAVAHRDYSMAGMRIRLHMFSDRLELLVPGALANTLTPDSLHLRQASRNELIVSLLARCPAATGIGRTRMMDRRGDGVPIILKKCEELSGRPPTYSVIDSAELRLVMWA